jgi:hypothetical protein
MNIAQATISGTRMDHVGVPRGVSHLEIAAEPLDHGAPNTDQRPASKFLAMWTIWQR